MRKAFLEFVDPQFLLGRQPRIPGGEWTVEVLRKKSIADLQYIWYRILKEKNKFNTMERHYQVHQEKLGAHPAPSRKVLLNKSLDNIRKVMRERDDIATQKATKIFEERMRKGIYRFPPGPYPLPRKIISTLLLELEEKPNEEEIRTFFGNPLVFEKHKGIVRVNISLPAEVLEQKRVAHEKFEEWFFAKQEYLDYHRYNDAENVADQLEFEIAPGVYSKGTEAKTIFVPDSMPLASPPESVMERIEWEGRSLLEKNPIQLGYFPNITAKPPSSPGPRPTHPDEIAGPWGVEIVLDDPHRAAKLVEEYKKTEHVSGIALVSIKECTKPPPPYASTCPLYAEAQRREKAYQLKRRNTPNLDEWLNRYKAPFRQKLEDIICYNYNNKVDYMEREARLVGQNLWESPIPIDHTCGRSYQIPTWLSTRDQWDADVPRFPMEFTQY